MSRHATGRPPGRPPGSGRLGKVKRVTVQLPEALYVRLEATAGRPSYPPVVEAHSFPPVYEKPSSTTWPVPRNGRHGHRLLPRPLPIHLPHRSHHASVSARPHPQTRRLP